MRLLPALGLAAGLAACASPEARLGVANLSGPIDDDLVYDGGVFHDRVDEFTYGREQDEFGEVGIDMRVGITE